MITSPEEYYWLCYVVVCDLETSWMKKPGSLGAVAPKIRICLYEAYTKVGEINISLIHFSFRIVWKKKEKYLFFIFLNFTLEHAIKKVQGQ